MAYARGVIVAVGLVAQVARAANNCADEDPSLGVQVTNRAGRLVIEAVTATSAAAGGNLRGGDVIIQANATLVRTCRDWAGALRDAKRERKAVLLLVERDGTPTPLAIAAYVWGVPSPEAVAAAKPAYHPAVPLPLSPLPETANVSVDGVRQDLVALAPADHLPTSLADYRHAVTQIRRALATLAVRQAAPSETINALRIALRPFEAAEVAWDALDGGRAQERRTRNVPVADEATAPYFEESPAAAVVDEFPFLRAAVASLPVPGLMQTAGQWRPVQARQLLWEHGRTQLGTTR